MFRLAIGRCDCREPYRDSVQAAVCRRMQDLLNDWRTRLPQDLASFPTSWSESDIIEGRRVSLDLHRVPVSSGDTLLVASALVHTWSRPTFIGLGAVGRLYAEGLLVKTDGTVETAPDELMWQVR